MSGFRLDKNVRVKHTFLIINKQVYGLAAGTNGGRSPK